VGFESVWFLWSVVAVVVCGDFVISGFSLFGAGLVCFVMFWVPMVLTCYNALLVGFVILFVVFVVI